MAISNVKSMPFGPGLQAIYGTYTHTVGAAEETQIVAGGQVYLVQINPQVSAGTGVDANTSLYSTSTSGAITTITVHQLAGISAGTFMVIFGTC